MEAKEQAEFMIKTHKSEKKALDAHLLIMKNIADIYPSIELCKQNSLTYSHLEDVERELRNKH